MTSLNKQFKKHDLSQLFHPISNKDIGISCTAIVTVTAENDFLTVGTKHRECIKAFISAHFKLISLRKLDNFNSDHYPIFVHLQYAPQNEDEQEDNQLEATAEDKEVAQEKKTADTSD